MRNDLGNLRGEGEVSGSLLVPVRHRGGAWRAIKCAVDLDRLNLAGVVGKEIARPHALRIKRASPSLCSERCRARRMGVRCLSGLCVQTTLAYQTGRLAHAYYCWTL